ncbi:polyprenyl synthetase family protein [Mycolicibacterium pulveris]|uniref:polyprenyl synthetase family protein n=1 Tax=Mycolicibacterium pulveris TaxID=36813 RepID=UPI003CFA28B2
MSVGDAGTCAVASVPVSAASWRASVRDAVSDAVMGFVAEHGADQLGETGVDITGDILHGFLTGGKCLRSTFMYLGWLCGQDEDPAALRAAASLELLHAFALLQDDVMDGATLRRGRPAAHVDFARWHRERGLSGSSERFGESAAVLLGDLCLVWAEQMWRESGVATAALSRAWPRYDAMRTELAVGQFADLVNDAAGFPTLDQVLDVSRRKSGNYTVRRPLEIGAALAGCCPAVLASLGGYGEAVGEAFQMRDDLLGIFGSASVTGKPAGVDLVERKATSVVVSAYQLADAPLRRQLAELMAAPDVDETHIDRWRDLIAATGAVRWIEQMIDQRVGRALERIKTPEIGEPVRKALADMAVMCTTRAA